ncbi:MAG: hypothetical protein ACYCSW_10895 [bacterium]
MRLYTNKWILFVQWFILFAGVIFLICAVIFNLPATNDEAIVGLKGIMLMILLVINTSSHSLYTSEFYYINNKCSNKNCTTDLKKDIKDFDDEMNGNRNNKNSSIRNVLTFNLFILNSSYFLIFSILINIIQTAGIIGKNKILVILSFYSFLIFLIIISINYLLYNYLLYKTFKKIIESD